MIDPADYFSVPLEDGLVVSNIKAEKVFTLNSTARLIWELLSEEADIDRIARHMTKVYPVEREDAERDVKMAIDSWHREGFLKKPDGDLKQSIASAVDQKTISPPAGAADYEFDYLMNNKKFRISYHGEAFKSILHSRLARATENKIALSHRIKVFECEGWYVVERDGEGVIVDSDLSRAVDRLFTEIIALQYPGLGILVYLHASSVSDGGSGIIFPGYYKQGKSTLTAALLTLGLDYFSDDITPVSFDTLDMISVPLNICLKSGSWDVIKPYYPDIYSLPIQDRYDGNEARYIPASTLQQGKNMVPVKAIVFPAREEGAEAKLEPISKLETLRLISDSSSIISSEPARVKRLVEWVENTPTYILHFGALDGALGIVREMFND